MNIVPLDTLRPGEFGRIYDVDGQEEIVHRLAEMGLQAGAAVRMVRCGEPCILAINHNRLCFRLDTSAMVLVDVDAADAAAELPACPDPA